MRLTTFLSMAGIVFLLWLFEVHKRISWSEVTTWRGYGELSQNFNKSKGYIEGRLQTLQPPSLSPSATPNPNAALYADPKCYDPNTKQKNSSCKWQPEPSTTPSASPNPNAALYADPKCYDQNTKQKNPSCKWQPETPTAPPPPAPGAFPPVAPSNPNANLYSDHNCYDQNTKQKNPSCKWQPEPESVQPPDVSREPDWMRAECDPNTIRLGSRLSRAAYKNHLTQIELGFTSPLLSDVSSRYCVHADGTWVFVPDWLDGRPDTEDFGYRLRLSPVGKPDIIEKPIGGRHV